MTKRKIIQLLKEQYGASSYWFKPYDLILEQDEKRYHIKVLQVSNKNLVTINSKTRWDIKSGFVDGIRFKTTSVRTVYLTELIDNSNPVIVLTNKPFQLLKYINESEVVEITDSEEVFGVKVFQEINELLDMFKKS